MTTEFDDIRPYTDDEIPSAMSRIASSQMLPLLASYVCPDKIDDKIFTMLERTFNLPVRHHVSCQRADYRQ